MDRRDFLTASSATALGLILPASAQAHRHTAHSPPLPPPPPPPGSLTTPPGGPWTLTMDDTFTGPLLDHWNYGTEDYTTFHNVGAYYPWGGSGSAPYWGSCDNPSTGFHNDYKVPGNVGQISPGLDPSLFNGYAPQAFVSTGSGLDIRAHHNPSPITFNCGPYGAVSRSWTTGALNTFGKVSFPSAGFTSWFVQIRAQMPSSNGICNGAWAGLWFLPQDSETPREVDLHETSVDGGNSTSIFASHLQTPQLSINDYNTGVDLSAAYHVYGVHMASNAVVTTYFDGTAIGTAQCNSTGPYFGLINLGIVGPGATWAVQPTYLQDMDLLIAEYGVWEA